MTDVRPREGGRYSLYCYDCGEWVPNTANAEMKKEGAFAYFHWCGKMKECPICDGDGKARGGSGGCVPYKCPTCNGTGKVPDVHIADDIKDEIDRLREEVKKYKTTKLTYSKVEDFQYIADLELKKDPKNPIWTLVQDMIIYTGKLEHNLYVSTEEIDRLRSELMKWKKEIGTNILLKDERDKLRVDTDRLREELKKLREKDKEGE